MKNKIGLIWNFIEDLATWVLLKIFGRNINLATTWNELNELQLKEITHSLVYYHNFVSLFPDRAKPAQYSRLYVQLVKQLLRKNNMFKVWYALKQIPPEHYEPYIKFLISEVKRTAFLSAFSFRGKKYHPPAARLQNLSVGEFSFADSLYFNWRQTNDDRYLNLLCATLYRKSRKKKNELDPRKPFTKLLVEKDAQRLKKLDHKKKLAIAYCFEGSRNYMAAQYPHVFPKPPKPTEEAAENQKPGKPVYVPFMRLLQHKIKFDPSKLEHSTNLNIYEFLNTYENELIELEKQKK